MRNHVPLSWDIRSAGSAQAGSWPRFIHCSPLQIRGTFPLIFFFSLIFGLNMFFWSLIESWGIALPTCKVLLLSLHQLNAVSWQPNTKPLEFSLTAKRRSHNNVHDSSEHYWTGGKLKYLSVYWQSLMSDLLSFVLTTNLWRALAVFKYRQYWSRRGSRINTDDFLNELRRRTLLGESGGMLLREIFWILIP